MKTLIVGAGALGGYFGARLLAAGKDVHFLVRERRQQQLATRGLAVRSPRGDLTIPDPPTVRAEQIAEHADIVVVACKAYDLDATMDSFAPAVGPHTVLLPLLNGMAHIDRLSARFGAGKVLPGLCFISASLSDDGSVLHHGAMEQIVFGERDGGRSERVDAIVAAWSPPGFELVASEQIVQEMWEKWVFIAALAGLTTLMRAAVADIMQADGGATGVLSGAYLKEASDSTWSDDAGVKSTVAMMRKYKPRAAMEFPAALGATIGALAVQTLRQCGNDLSRGNVLAQTMKLDVTPPMLLPGLAVKTSPDSRAILSQLRFQQFDGTAWRLLAA